MLVFTVDFSLCGELHKYSKIQQKEKGPNNMTAGNHN